jgi:hypothetical protein
VGGLGDTMQKFNSRAYSISDFLEWRQNNLLDISPEFQRRNVWTRAAKSYLIDTVVRGKPMPKILITQELVNSRSVRTVVDGQQRIRAILEFINGDFSILPTHNSLYGRKHFGELPIEIQKDILEYELGVDLLYEVDLKDLLDIFARINTYSVTLNPQEKLNAKYLGVFKGHAYELGHTYANYFLDGGVLTKKLISRMGEAQLSSDLLVALVGGVQTVKNIEKYYKQYEYIEEVPQLLMDAMALFHETMSYINVIYPSEDIQVSNWSRVHWFYTLFVCVAYSLNKSDGLIKGLDEAKRPILNRDTIGQWRVRLDEISARFDEYTGENAPEIPRDFASYIDFARRRTTDTEARKERSKFVLAALSA